MDILFLVLFNFIFFWKIWANPFIISRSELLSTFFPSWLHIGRQIRKFQSWRLEPCYWLNFHSHPVLSSYYPPHVLTAWIASFYNLDNAFKLLTRIILVHFIWMSLGWYYLLSVNFTSFPLLMFGALTLTYSAYNIKQQPCLVYTISWFGWLLYGSATHNLFISSLSCGMTLLAGYYPLGMQTIGISGLLSLLWGWDLRWVPVGILIGLPQLIPFFKYLPKTIRDFKHDHIGRVPFWHFFSLFMPNQFKRSINGVGFWEMSYYCGMTTLMALIAGLSTSGTCKSAISQVWILGVGAIFLMLGVGGKWLPRIPARWSFTLQFCLGWIAVSGLESLHLSTLTLYGLLFIQGFDLYWHNSVLFVTRPYSELHNRPNRAFNTQITRYLTKKCQNWRISGLPYPLFTGIINNFKTLGYCGGMQLKLMAKWRNDRNPNGSGEHDWFKSNGDSDKLDIQRVKFAYTRKRIDWEPTPIRWLWSNPRLQSSPS